MTTDYLYTENHPPLLCKKEGFTESQYIKAARLGTLQPLHTIHEKAENILFSDCVSGKEAPLSAFFLYGRSVA